MGSDALDRVAFAAWLIFIAILTLTPLPAGTPGPYSIDKAVHFGLFFVFALLAFRLRKEPSWESYTIIILGALVYGTMIEFAQMFIPGRFFDVLDITAGVVGAFAYFAIVAFANSRTGYTYFR